MGVQIKQVATIDLHPVNSPDYDGTPDMADLPSNNEAGVVHNLRTRYLGNNIYVSTPPAQRGLSSSCLSRLLANRIP